MFTIDGMTWPYPIDVTRNAEIRSTEVSGEMLDGSYYNDVEGTYFNYTVRVAVPLNQRNMAAQYYEALVDPVDGHTFVLPYNNNTVIVVGRVEDVSDVFVRLPNGEKYWKGLQFTVIANAPTYAYSAAELIARGRSVMPEPASPSEGDTWVWTNGAWALTVHYDDADAIRY